jgi:hypothetical protein
MTKEEILLYNEAQSDKKSHISINGVKYDMNTISTQGFSPIYNLVFVQRQKLVDNIVLKLIHTRDQELEYFVIDFYF